MDVDISYLDNLERPKECFSKNDKEMTVENLSIPNCTVMDSHQFNTYSELINKPTKPIGREYGRQTTREEEDFDRRDRRCTAILAPVKGTMIGVSTIL